MNCAEIRELLAEKPDLALDDSGIREHLLSCAACSEFVRCLAEVDAALRASATDAGRVAVPAGLVVKTVDAVRARSKLGRHRLLKLSLAAGVPVVLLLVTFVAFQGRMRDLTSTVANTLSGKAEREDDLAPRGPELQRKNDSKYYYTDSHGLTPPGKNSESPPVQPDEEAVPKPDVGGLGMLSVNDHEGKLDKTGDGLDKSEEAWNHKYTPPSSRTTMETLLTGEHVKSLKRYRERTFEIIRLPESEEASGKDELEQNPRHRDDDRDRKSRESTRAATGYLVVKSLPNQAQVYIDGRQLDASKQRVIKLAAGKHSLKVDRPGYSPYHSTVSVRDGERTELKLDAGRKALDQLKFIPARGYFANTYLPGDAALTWLRRKLEGGLRIGGRRLAIENDAVPYRQPFDAPLTHGLDVFLNTDRTAIEGPARVTIQVGLKGAVRGAGRRAAINSAVVVDLRQVPDENQRRTIWTVADAIAAQQQSGDRHRLVVAGVDRPVRVEPGGFDQASVRRELVRALQQVEEKGPSGSLDEALQAAYNTFAVENPDDAPLGANMVVLVSADPAIGQLDKIVSRVRQEALLGIHFVALGVGKRADMVSLSKLAMAGQGRRRLVGDAGGARRVVEDELAASGRVVARALRLRIRLAAGVKLVGVLGSHPLTADQSQQERKVEQAIDRRIAKTLGIQADRGRDEDGIQIIIPAFYAGDEHVILLDVVAPGPGKLADVRVRYKDLIGMRNSVALASLSLPAGPEQNTPLSLNVRKNLVAFHVSRALLKAAELLDANRAAAAESALAGAAGQIESLKMSYAGLADDRELDKDARMLAEYRRVLRSRSNWSDDQDMRIKLVYSLAYAGKVKLPPGDRR